MRFCVLLAGTRLRHAKCLARKARSVLYLLSICLDALVRGCHSDQDEGCEFYEPTLFLVSGCGNIVGSAILHSTVNKISSVVIVSQNDIFHVHDTR